MKRNLLIFTCLYFSKLFYANIQSINDSDLVVQTKYGKLRGCIENNLSVWKGIKYAKAPVGNLRFKAPQPLDKWEGIKDATQFGYIAPQTKSLYADGITNEDCLHLNIWSPAPDNKKRPVMFWIHGGGFSQGCGSTSIYDGTELVKKGDVVVVTINYRLGPLAFLYFDDIAPNNTTFENNLGIKDQIAALKWVKENIENFGGDPDRITIFGQSSGATSVMTIMSCPSSKGLFKNAIAESPSLNFWNKEDATFFTNNYLSMLGISKNNLSQISNLPLDSLINVSDRILKDPSKIPGIGIFSPTIDGTFLPQKPIDAVASGQTKDIPLLIGTNRDEANVFKLYSTRPVSLEPEDINKRLSIYAPNNKEKITSAYPNYPKEQAILNIITDGVFRIPSINVAEAQSKHSPTWMYRMDWASLPLKIKGYKSFHALEIFFVFKTFDNGIAKKLTMLTNKNTLYKVSNEIQDAWINFAKTGNPNDSTLSKYWSTYDEKKRATMIFDKNTKLLFDPNAKQRQSWSEAKFF